MKVYYNESLRRLSNGVSNVRDEELELEGNLFDVNFEFHHLKVMINEDLILLRYKSVTRKYLDNHFIKVVTSVASFCNILDGWE